MTTIAVGIDLTKHVFAVQGVDESGRAALLRSSVAGDKLRELIATLPSLCIGVAAMHRGNPVILNSVKPPMHWDS